MTTHLPARLFPLVLVVLLAVLVIPLQAQVLSSATVMVGGAGSIGCQGPGGTLSGGFVATGTLDYAYDQGTNILSLTVDNTSPDVPGTSNPVITRIYLNLPHLAVSSVTLLSQTAAGGATPAYLVTYDTDLYDGMNPIGAGCLGKFGVRLAKSNSSVQGGIANPLAAMPGGPTGSQVIGPITFDLLIQGPGAATLNAAAFANSYSYKPNGTEVAAALKFQAGGPNANRGGYVGSFVNAGQSSIPGAWVLGDPTAGGTVTFVLSAVPGSAACLVISLNPGPTSAGGLMFPIGTPFVTILSGIIPQNTPIDTSRQIPPSLTTPLTLFGAAIAVDPMMTKIEASDQFQVMIGG